MAHVIPSLGVPMRKDRGCYRFSGGPAEEAGWVPATSSCKWAGFIPRPFSFWQRYKNDSQPRVMSHALYRSAHRQTTTARMCPSAICTSSNFQGVDLSYSRTLGMSRFQVIHSDLDKRAGQDDTAYSSRSLRTHATERSGGFLLWKGVRRRGISSQDSGRT